jgi:DNA polymerase elongation subunit (family B)
VSQKETVETSAHGEDVHLSVRMPVERRMSLMSMELLAPLKTGDNSNTEVVSLVYSFQPETSQGATFHCITGVLALGPFPQRRLHIAGISYEFPADELSLINRLAELVMHFDPDILVGWDLKRGSWGYLATRAASYGDSASPPYPQLINSLLLKDLISVTQSLALLLPPDFLQEMR